VLLAARDLQEPVAYARQRDLAPLGQANRPQRGGSGSGCCEDEQRREERKKKVAAQEEERT
jgi:hypothetical protein